MTTRSAAAFKATDERYTTVLRPAPQPRYCNRRDEKAVEICEAMIDICAALYNVCGKELRQAGRTSNAVARVRQIAMYVAHVGLGISMQDVGCGFFRDRTTVRHACLECPRQRGRTMTSRMAVANSSRMTTEPPAPMTGTRVAASAPPNCTETMPARTRTGAGTRSAADVTGSG